MFAHSYAAQQAKVASHISSMKIPNLKSLLWCLTSLWRSEQPLLERSANCKMGFAEQSQRNLFLPFTNLAWKGCFCAPSKTNSANTTPALLDAAATIKAWTLLLLQHCIFCRAHALLEHACAPHCSMCKLHHCNMCKLHHCNMCSGCKSTSTKADSGQVAWRKG